MRLAIGALVLLALLGATAFIAKRVLLDSAPAPPRSQRALDLGRLRQLARSLDAPLPRRINGELIAESTLPGVAVVAGGGFGPHPIVHTSFQVVYRDRTTIIDAAMNRELAESLSPDATFYPERYQVLQTALRQADLIVVTHEHADHIGGLGHAPYAEEILPSVVLTQEQIENPAELVRAGFSEQAMGRVRVLDYERHHVLEPGVVLVKAPGHTPGSQMIYVLLQSGDEFLLVGDVVWDRVNIQTLTGRPRLVTDFLEIADPLVSLDACVRERLREDREAILDQLRMLHDFARAHEEVHIVVSHDASLFRRQLRSRVIGDAFELR